MRKLRNINRAKRAKVIFIASLLLFCVTLVLCTALSKAEPILVALSENRFKNIITNTVYDITKELDLSNVVMPYYNSEGEITSVKTDTFKINLAVNQILNELENRLEDKDIEIKIPVGDILDNSLSLGQGPYLTVELNQYKAVNADIASSFEEAGINQTLHRLTLILEVEAIVLLPGVRTEKIFAVINMPLSETLIVGKAPSTYIEAVN